MPDPRNVPGVARISLIHLSEEAHTMNRRARPRASAIVLILAVMVAACTNENDQATETADRLARQHQNDTPRSNIDTSAIALPVASGPVTYGGSFAGFEAWPDTASGTTADTATAATAASYPGLILIHEWWGLNDNMRDMARQLAGQGYRVLAVDLYDGNVATDPQTARGYVQQAMQNERALLQNLEAAYTHLAETRGSGEVGVMGYCFGGGMALNAALAMPEDLDALVIYYGQLTTDGDRLEVLDMPVLGIFGAEDEGIPVDQVQAFDETLNELGKEAEIHIFPGAGHAFANPSGEAFVPEAAGQAWSLTTAFLDRHLQ